MPLTINVGLSKKLALPDYGSLGATCSVQFEGSAALLEQDLDGLHRQVRDAYLVCHQAIEDELARRQATGDTTAKPRQPGGSNGHANGRGVGASGNGHAQHSGTGPRPATASQIRAVYGICNRLRLDPIAMLRKQYGVERPEDLSLRDASTLIDELKASSPRPAGGQS